MNEVEPILVIFEDRKEKEQVIVIKTQQVINKFSSKRGQDHATYLSVNMACDWCRPSALNVVCDWSI